MRRKLAGRVTKLCTVGSSSKLLLFVLLFPIYQSLRAPCTREASSGVRKVKGKLNVERWRVHGGTKQREAWIICYTLVEVPGVDLEIHPDKNFHAAASISLKYKLYTCTAAVDYYSELLHLTETRKVLKPLMELLERKSTSQKVGKYGNKYE